MPLALSDTWNCRNIFQSSAFEKNTLRSSLAYLYIFKVKWKSSFFVNGVSYIYQILPFNNRLCTSNFWLREQILWRNHSNGTSIAELSHSVCCYYHFKFCFFFIQYVSQRFLKFFTNFWIGGSDWRIKTVFVDKNSGRLLSG